MCFTLVQTRTRKPTTHFEMKEAILLKSKANDLLNAKKHLIQNANNLKIVTFN